MYMNVTCCPVREIYKSPLGDYRVLACAPIGIAPGALKVNKKYGDFTLAGSNLGGLKVGEVIELDIRENKTGKYENSYVLIGYGGIDADGEEIKVDPNQELAILKTLMTYDQAKYVHDAYPNFVYLVLNNKEEEIDYNNIFNVGAIRLESYIDKVKASCKSVLFMPVAFDYGLEDTTIVEKLTNIFMTPEELQEAFDDNPYHIFIDVAKYSFKKADEIIIGKHPEMVDNYHRCEYATYYILNMNESNGDTRINANLLARIVKKMVPQAAKHIVDVVKENELIYYDEETKYASFKRTYKAEVSIAEAILKRKSPDFGNVDDSEKPDIYAWIDSFSEPDEPIDWTKFKEVDGFKITDEQTKILQLAIDENVMILTGGAGTGKTSSLKALIRMLNYYHKSFILLAPTGIAAKKLKESTGKEASTIHKFLVCPDHSPVDYVIIDEFSMVSVPLMGSLINSLNKIPYSNPKLVFVCDEAQLASIDCGNLVQDILDSKIVPHANLTKVFRYGEGGIATIATDARFGTFEHGEEKFSDYQFIPIGEDPLAQVLEVYEDYINRGYKKEDIIVLSPYNKGRIGTFAINKALQQKYNHHTDLPVYYERNISGEKVSINFRIGDKVLNTHNNYNVQAMDFDDEGNLIFTNDAIPVMNGDIGYIRAFKENTIDEIDIPSLVVDFDEGIGLMTGSEISDLILGYSISIHKIQGAQAKAVIVVIDRSHKHMLTRNLFYVGASRAQECMTIIGDKYAIQAGLTIEENKTRETWLKDLLLKGETMDEVHDL